MEADQPSMLIESGTWSGEASPCRPMSLNFSPYYRITMRSLQAGPSTTVFSTPAKAGDRAGHSSRLHRSVGRIQPSLGWRGHRRADYPGRDLGLAGLLSLQFGLGITNVFLRLPMWSRALHLTAAATIWAGVVALWTVIARGHRLSMADTEPVSAGA